MATLRSEIKATLNMDEIEFMGAAITAGKMLQVYRNGMAGINKASVIDFDRKTGEILIDQEGLRKVIALINPRAGVESMHAPIRVVDELPRDAHRRMEREGQRP